jgi:NAD(P)-dependent dehydrogenase (short-subunit alcohol dehydrogenase family)
MKLANKIALVTGGGRGIGRAIVERLAHEGALLIVHYGSNKRAAEATVKAVEAAGGTAFIQQAEMGSAASIESMFHSIDAELVRRRGEPRFDILVNNAGVSSRATFEETDEVIFDEIFSVNVKGLFFTIKHSLPRLRDGGRIINLSSMSARRARPRLPAYSASKAAVDALTASLAKLLGPRGITVNGIAPGAIQTELTSALINSGDPKWKAYYASRSIMGRIGQPEDIASVAAFLASADAGWITGETIMAGGGQEL